MCQKLGISMNMKKLHSINKLFLVTTFAILLFAAMEFIYIFLHSFKLAPNYTGTVSDILIATANVILAIFAILAYKNLSSLFKEKISSNAIDKIDTVLISLDECIDKLSSLFLNYTLIKIFKEAKDYKEPNYVKLFDEASKNTTEAMEYAYKAKSVLSALKRWNISLDTELGQRQQKLIDDSFELCIASTKIIIALTNEMNPKSKFPKGESFDNLFDAFNTERKRLQEENDELKNSSIHDIFKIQ